MKNPNIKLKTYLEMEDMYIYCLRGTNQNGETILIPYYCLQANNAYIHLGEKMTFFENQRQTNKQVALKMVNDEFNGIEFDDIGFYAPIPTCKTHFMYDFLYEAIHVSNNSWRYLNEYIHTIIKNAYLFNEAKKNYILSGRQKVYK